MQALTKEEKPVERHAQVGVECPQCHLRQFMEVEVDERLLNAALYQEIRSHLEEWLKSRCPDHLGEIAKLSKN
jgi:hypothetical protein